MLVEQLAFSLTEFTFAPLYLFVVAAGLIVYKRLFAHFSFILIYIEHRNDVGTLSAQKVFKMYLGCV